MKIEFDDYDTVFDQIRDVCIDCVDDEISRWIMLKDLTGRFSFDRLKYGNNIRLLEELKSVLFDDINDTRGKDSQ